MKDLMALLKAASDQNRVRLLMALRHGELCVCQLIEFIQLAPSTVSKHMSILRNADMVESRKKGRWVYYRLPVDEKGTRASAFLSWLEEALDEDLSIRNDMKRLEEVIKNTPLDSCKD